MVIPDPNCRRVFRLLRRPWSGVIALPIRSSYHAWTVRYTFYTFSKSRFLFLNRTGLSGRPLHRIIYSMYKRSYFSPFNCSSPKLSPPLFPHATTSPDQMDTIPGSMAPAARLAPLRGIVLCIVLPPFSSFAICPKAFVTKHWQTLSRH